MNEHQNKMQVNHRKGKGRPPKYITLEEQEEKKQNKNTNDHQRRENNTVKLERLENGTEGFNKEMEEMIGFFKENQITTPQQSEVELWRLREEGVKHQDEIRELEGEAKAQQERREEFFEPFIQHQFITQQDLTKHEEKRSEIQSWITDQETKTEGWQVGAKELLGFFREYPFTNFNHDQKDKVEKLRRMNEEYKAKIENLQNKVKRRTGENKRLQELHKKLTDAIEKLPEDGNSIDFQTTNFKKLKVDFERRLPDEIRKLQSVYDQLEDKIMRLEKLTNLFGCFKESQMAYSVFLLQYIMQRLYKNFPRALLNQDCKDNAERNFLLLLANLRDVTWSGQAGMEKLLLELSELVKIVDLYFDGFTTTTSDKMETNGQINQECTAANELAWNGNYGGLIDEGMQIPGMKETNECIDDFRGRLFSTEEELLGNSSTHAEARFSEEFSNLECAALYLPPGPGTTSHVKRRNDEEKVELLALAKQTDAGRLLTVEKGKSVMLEDHDNDSPLSSSSVTLPMDAPRGRGRGRSSRGSRGRGHRNASLVIVPPEVAASLANVHAGKRSGDPNPRPQQRLRPIGVTTPIPSLAVQGKSLWNSLDVTKSRAVTLFSESDNADARTFMNTCTPEDALQLNSFKLLNVCQVAIQEARSRGAELARAKGEAERALDGERVALSKVEHLKKELAHEKAERSKLDKTNASLELQVRRNRRAYVESWVGSQSFANTLDPFVHYHFALGFSKCRAWITQDDPGYDISWLRATPSERFKWDGSTLMQEPLKPPPVYFDEEGGVPPPHTFYARLEPYENEVPFAEDGGQGQEELAQE